MRSRILQAGLGLLVAACGNALAEVAAFVGARSMGGAYGCDVDLDSGGRGAVLMGTLFGYFAAHFLLGGIAVGLSIVTRRPPAYWVALVGGWVVFVAASIVALFSLGC